MKKFLHDEIHTEGPEDRCICGSLFNPSRGINGSHQRLERDVVLMRCQPGLNHMQNIRRKIDLVQGMEHKVSTDRIKGLFHVKGDLRASEQPMRTVVRLAITTELSNLLAVL